MAGNGGTGAGSGAGERRLGETVVVAVCVCSLVVAGALAPAVGSPFDDGPALNLSTFTEGANGSEGGIPEGARDLTGPLESSGAPRAIGSPDSSAVGGASALSGFRNQSGGVQFVVEAERNTYYRVGAYDSFDGYGWSRDGGTTPFSGAVPGATPPGERFGATVTLNATAFAVPVPWRPTTVEGPTPLSARSTEGIVPRTSLAANQSFRVTAVAPTRDPSVLGETGYDYPSRVERQYLGVDDSVSPRVGALATRITADASDPYAAATAIEAWLEANKSYSLSATTDPDRPVTRQFLFEMERGYCQYFASAMAVMLRTQGIPARYVVGYAPGEPVAEDTYAVTGAKAHAWVEVYFEDVGWVRFDPTPASGRLAADAAVTNESAVADAATAVNGTTGTAPTPDGGDGTGTTDDRDGTATGEGGDGTDGASDGDGAAAGTLNVTLVPEPTPGVEVTVRVTRSGEPVVGADVYFDEEYVGRTNIDGEVEAVVPYRPNLTVRVADDDETVRASVPPPPGRGGAGSGQRFGANGLWAGSPPDDESNGTTTEVSVATEMTFSFASRPLPGSMVAMRVTINGEPVGDARVSLDGEPAGRTNATGWVRVALPGTASTVRVAAERGEVRDSASLSLHTTPNLSLEGDVVPASQVRVTATYDGERLEGAEVFVDGERVGTTGPSGRATLLVPSTATGTLDVRVERGVVSGTASPAVVTDGSVTVEGRASPTGTATVVVEAAGEGVPGATVSVAGKPATSTDLRGRATVQVPGNATGNVTVTASRGSFEATRSIDLFEPNVSVTPAYLVPLPGSNVTANVTDGGEPVSDASVAVAPDPAESAGAVAGETDGSGVVETSLPFRNAASVRATVAGATTTTRLDWLYLNLVGTVALLAGGLVLGVGALVQRGRVGAVAARARRVAARVGGTAMDALFAVAARADALVAALPSTVGRVRVGLRRALAAPAESARVLVTGAVALLARAVAGGATWARALRGSGSLGEASEPVGAGERAAAGDGMPSLVDAWRRLVALASPTRVRTRTPGEVGQIAVERGLPREPVEALTEAYRRVVYGGEPPDEAVTSTAQSAAAALERAAERSPVTAGTEDAAEQGDGETGSPAEGEPGGREDAGGAETGLDGGEGR